MKVVIIEDETAAASNLTALIAEYRYDMQVVAVLESVADSVEWFSSNPMPDLVFTDIRLADGNAFTVFRRVHIDCPVVFTTAYDNYALQAFEVNSIDYLLKPIKSSDLKRAVEKLERLTCKQREDYTGKLRSMAGAETADVLLVRIRDRIVPLKFNEIAYCFSTDEKVTVCTLKGDVYPFDKPLETLGRMLPPVNFFRANRQFLIGREAVRDVSVWFGNRLAVNLSVKTPERIVVSKAKTPQLRRWLTGLP